LIYALKKIFNMKKVICLIPARSGSSILDKNIKIYKKKPLIFHSINVALKSKFIKRIIISTDSLKYKKLILKNYKKNVEVPFIRPKKISGDKSSDHSWLKHALVFLKRKENYIPDIVVQLRPTTPNRNVKVVDKAISFFLNNYNKASSLRSANEFSQPPEKMFRITNGYFKGYFNKKKLVEYYNFPRQKFAKPYLPNGYIDILKSSIILNSNLLHGNKILPFITSQTNDIDSLDDFKKK